MKLYLKILILILVLVVFLIPITTTSNFFNKVVYKDILPFRSDDERLEYYIGDLDSNSNYDYDKHNDIISLSDSDIYKKDIDRIVDLCNITEELPFLSGDIQYNSECSALSKSRPILNANKFSSNILLPLEYDRHMKYVFDIIKDKADEKSWYKKSDKLVWRGVTTGNVNKPHSRFKLVEKYFDETWCDIAFSGICQDKDEYKKFVRDSIPEKVLLNHKYLLSIEGNDVASNIKWMLASNSVVLSPKFTIESWFAEGKLLPYIHYVPISYTFDDLKEKYDWCVNNPDECRVIADNATQFVKYFLDEKKENSMICKVISKLNNKMKLVKFQNNLKRY